MLVSSFIPKLICDLYLGDDVPDPRDIRVDNVRSLPVNNESFKLIFGWYDHKNVLVKETTVLLPSGKTNRYEREDYNIKKNFRGIYLIVRDRHLDDLLKKLEDLV